MRTDAQRLIAHYSDV